MLSVSQIQQTAEPIMQATNITKLVLFGSYAKGTATQTSDIDFYIITNGITGFAFFDIKARLEDALSAEIDLIPDQDVIPDSPIDKEIRETGVVIYEK